MKTLLFNLLFFAFRKRAAVFPGNPARILVIRQDNRIGNLILITPFLALLKKRWPSARVDVVAGGSFGRVLGGNPDIDRILIYDQLRFIRMPWRFVLFVLHLRRQHYDLVFDLKPVFSFNNMMLTVLCGARFRVGFQNQLSNSYFHEETPLPDPNLYEGRFLAELLARHLSVDPLPPLCYSPESRYVREAEAWLLEHKLDPKKLVAIHAGGRGQKRIGAEEWARLARTLTQNGYAPLLILGPDESKGCAFFVSRGFSCVTPECIGRLGGFLSHVRLFISGDTGPMHMAAGAGIPTLSFFVASSVDRYAPCGPLNTRCNLAETPDPAGLAISLLCAGRTP